MSLPSPLRAAKIEDASSPKLFSQFWSGWFRSVWKVLNPGISATVTIPKLTGGGTNGSIIVQDGIITKVVQPT